MAMSVALWHEPEEETPDLPESPPGKTLRGVLRLIRWNFQVETVLSFLVALQGHSTCANPKEKDVHGEGMRIGAEGGI